MFDVAGEMNEIKLIIDGDYFPFIACHGNKVMEEDGVTPKKDEFNHYIYTEKTLEEALYHIDNLLINIFQHLQATHYIGFLKSGVDNFRKKILPTYKANRIGKELPKYFHEVRQRMIDEWSFLSIECPIEVDDMALITAYNHENSILVSSDKDLLTSYPLCFDIRNNTFKQNSEYNINYAFWLSMLVGDSADNIKGCLGLGKKKAPLVLERLTEPEDMRKAVIDKYIETYGYFWLEEFYKNYYSLYILRDLKELPSTCEFQIPEVFQMVPGTY